MGMLKAAIEGERRQLAGGWREMTVFLFREGAAEEEREEALTFMRLKVAPAFVDMHVDCHHQQALRTFNRTPARMLKCLMVCACGGWRVFCCWTSTRLLDMAVIEMGR